MRRRSLLAACATGIAWLAGCAGRNGSTGEAATPDETVTQSEVPSPSETATPTRTRASTETPTTRTETTRTETTPTANPAQNFATSVREIVDDEVSFSRAGNTWSVEYAASVVSGTPFRRQQTRIAKRFADSQPAGDAVTLEATVYHECTTVRWTVPAELARSYDRGEIGTEELRARLANRTRREDNC